MYSGTNAIGSVPLDEVNGFCKDEQLGSVFGEAKGDYEELWHWYQNKGFDLNSVDNIQLSFLRQHHFKFLAHASSYPSLL